MKYLSMLCAAMILGGGIALAQDVPTENITKYAPSGVKRNFRYIAWISPDCSSDLEIVVKVETPPMHGKVETFPGEGFSTFSANSPQAACNNKKTRGVNLYYQSDPHYVGEDQFSILILYSTGAARKANYKVNVVGSQTNGERQAESANPVVTEPYVIPPKVEAPKYTVALPPTGIMHARQAGQAPFNIDNRASDQHYVIKLVNVNTRKKEITVFVRARSHIDSKVPFGRYRILGVYGTDWYGDKDYFGDESAFFKVVRKDEGEIMEFYRENRKNGQWIAHGGTLALRVEGGNAPQQRISRADFEDN
jgi:hypothetical protein